MSKPNGNGHPLAEIRTTGQLRAALGRLLARVENGTIDANDVKAACAVANSINQTFAEETKAMLAAKELGLIKPAFGHTLIGEPEEEQRKQIVGKT